MCVFFFLGGVVFVGVLVFGLYSFFLGGVLGLFEFVFLVGFCWFLLVLGGGGASMI